MKQGIFGPLIFSTLFLASVSQADEPKSGNGFFDDSIRGGFFDDSGRPQFAPPARTPAATAVPQSPPVPAIRNSISAPLGKPVSETVEPRSARETQERVLETIQRARPLLALPLRQESPGPSKEKEKTVTQTILPNSDAAAKFSREYKSRSVLSLVVSGVNGSHLIEQLNRLLALKEQRHVAIGRILIIGGSPNLNEKDWSRTELPVTLANSNDKADDSAISLLERTAPRTSFGQMVAKLDLKAQPMLSADSELKKLNITYSPTWVVRYQGKDYVFEGNFAPERLFSSSGMFIGGS